MKRIQPSLLTPLVVGALMPGTLPAQTLFSDNFNSNTAANWDIRSTSADTAVTFAFDYSALGIPSAPNSGGSTLGLKLEANIADPAAAEAISLSPLGGSFSGDFSVRYDLWINYNGPLSPGGTGSTQFPTSGVGTSGGQVQWGGTGSAADGVWFAVSGDGGAAQDFRAYVATAQQADASGVYAAGVTLSPRDNGNPYYATTFPGGLSAPAAQIASYPQQTNTTAVGTIGFAWRDVEITRVGDVITWSIDGLLIATVTNALAADNIFLGYWDPFTSVSTGPDVQFGLVDNLRIEVVPEPSTMVLGLLGLAGFWAVGRRSRRPQS